MRLERLLVLGVMWMGASGVACGGSVSASTGEAGSGGSTTSETVSTGGGGTTGSGAGGGASTSGGSGGAGGGIEGCADACSVTADGGCLQKADCIAYCDMASPSWPAGVLDAFATCVAEHPLCFESIDGCLLQELNPPGKLHPVHIEGSGFGQYDGKTLRVWHDPELNIPFGGEVVLAGGVFSFDWNEPVQASEGGPLMLLYIDMDGDGACTAAGDLTASVMPPWNGDLVNPAYEAVLTPPLADPDFVCDFTP